MVEQHQLLSRGWAKGVCFFSFSCLLLLTIWNRWAVSTGAATAPGADNKKKDDDFDLFGEDEEDEEYEREVERRAKEAADKKVNLSFITKLVTSLIQMCESLLNHFMPDRSRKNQTNRQEYCDYWCEAVGGHHRLEAYGGRCSSHRNWWSWVEGLYVILFFLLSVFFSLSQFHSYFFSLPAKLAEIGYGIKKLQISCHIEDEKVSVDDIQEKIQELEDYVQSTDIVSFSKL